MGWAIGLLVAALVLRHGMGASIAWAAIFALAPLCQDLLPHRHPARLAATAGLDLTRQSCVRGNAGGTAGSRSGWTISCMPCC
ncbi:MAG: hypothetical protein R3F36_00530 [Candidatus Competibacteraceae bacterium]